MGLFQLCKLIAQDTSLTALVGFDSVLAGQHDHPDLADLQALAPLNSVIAIQYQAG
jgi:hypothetical protein